MTRIEHLLTILAEECAEVAQRCTKALRFGLNEVQPEQNETNAERIAGELDHIGAVTTMLREGGLLPSGDPFARAAKRAKVEQYLRYSAECGTLDEPAQSSAGAEDTKP
jgi:hypothetical protein